jgi:dolichol-phosphate mannosyltransferase
MGRSSVTVVIPAYDEAESLRALLPELRRVLDGLPDHDARIHVVVRTGADEAELDEVLALGAQPLRRGPGDSFGDAIRTGIRSVPSDVDYVLFMDADGSHSPATVPRLLEWGTDNDVVVASRYVHGGQSDNSPLLRGMSRTLNLGFRVVLGIPCQDVSTNFKLYHREALQRITLTCDNFDIVEEILFRLHRQAGKREFRVHEVPDYFHERTHGDSKRRLGPFVASYLVTLIRLRLTSGN